MKIHLCNEMAQSSINRGGNSMAHQRGVIIKSQLANGYQCRKWPSAHG